MAKIDNFTRDEHVIAFLVLSKFILIQKLSDIDNVSANEINNSLTTAIIDQFASMTDENLREAINKAKTSTATGIAYHRSKPNSVLN